MKRFEKPILNCLIGLNLALIWGASLMTGAESGAMSGGVLEWLCSFLPVLATEAGHHFLRKAAPFSEFCLLGILIGARRTVSGGAVNIGLAGFGLLTACIDETIQIYVPDRGSSLTDVWLDTAGFVTGLSLCVLVRHLTQHFKEKSK